MSKKQFGKRIGILTGGGDCPGLNALIRAVTKSAIHLHGMEVVGFLDGFEGLVEDRTMPLTYDSVSNIIAMGGTILGTSSRGNLFQVPEAGSRRVRTGRNRAPDALRTFRKHRLDGLLCVGGDGTLTIAHFLHRRGIPIIGIPKTIDNDVPQTDRSFGFDTAGAVAAEAVDRLHTTAASHHRVMILEVMGRHAGWIALHAGLAGGGDVILIPEIPFSLKTVCEVVTHRSRRGRRYSLIVVAEGAYPRGGSPVTYRRRLGGIGPLLAQQLEEKLGLESRATILGHLQRGGTPTPFDRVLATQFGHAAVMLAAKGRYGKMVRLKDGAISAIGLAQVAGRPKAVPLNSPLIAAARAVGTSLGE